MWNATSRCTRTARRRGGASRPVRRCYTPTSSIRRQCCTSAPQTAVSKTTARSTSCPGTARYSRNSATPGCVERRALGCGRRPLVDDQLELARPRIDGQIVRRHDYKANVVHALASEDLAQAPRDALDRHVARSGVERGVEAHHEAKLVHARELQLKASYARDEHFVDRMRTDEILDAVAIPQHGLQLIATHEALDHEIRRVLA